MDYRTQLKKTAPAFRALRAATPLHASHGLAASYSSFMIIPYLLSKTVPTLSDSNLPISSGYTLHSVLLQTHSIVAASGSY